MIEMSAKVDVGGPLFNPTIRQSAMLRYRTEAMRNVARRGEDLVRLDYDAHHRHPSTPSHARSQVTSISDPELALIGDGGIVYGPWLEGVAERNRTTRFKGYRTFRRMRQRLAREAPGIARRTLPRHLRALGGR